MFSNYILFLIQKEMRYEQGEFDELILGRDGFEFN